MSLQVVEREKKKGRAGAESRKYTFQTIISHWVPKTPKVRSKYVLHKADRIKKKDRACRVSMVLETKSVEQA